MPPSTSPRSTGVRLCLVLIDYLWFDDPQRRLALLDRHGASAFLDRVIDPFLERYGKANAIHSFDLINEPDFMIRELATDPRRAVWPLDRLRDLRGNDVGAHSRPIARARHAGRRARRFRAGMGSTRPTI